jgi:hypothetical protein
MILLAQHDSSWRLTASLASERLGETKTLRSSDGHGDDLSGDWRLLAICSASTCWLVGVTMAVRREFFEVGRTTFHLDRVRYSKELGMLVTKSPALGISGNATPSQRCRTDGDRMAHLMRSIRLFCERVIPAPCEYEPF